jgi:radical SAM protein with 4Fe4S-binding SPASM domain
MLNQATQYNIARKATYADNLQLLPDGTPLFSWLDLSLTELCNRSAGSPKACVFCPRIDANFYPNQKLHMSVGTGQLIAWELHDLNYQGAVILCGFGEPLLHPDLEKFVTAFKGLRVELVTNGDRLNADKIGALYESGVSYIVVSMYDGPHQVEKFHDMFHAAGCQSYGLRDRWHSADLDYGLKLTNRAGTIQAGNQPAVDVQAPCHYPAYSMAVDWNGDVLLCVQDWNKKLRFGNVAMSSLVDCWKSPALHKRRMQLIRGERCAAPCDKCNAQGTIHGNDHVHAWVDILTRS